MIEDDGEFAAWFRLIETPGIGRTSARAMLAAFGSAPAVFDASSAQRRGVIGAAAAPLDSPPAELAERLTAAQAWRHAGDDRHVLAIGDAAYPALLLQTADPPLLLYVQGRVDVLSAPAIAIVGSRNPTPQGADNARGFAKFLSDAGQVVVSGLAAGIDGAAHEGAMAGRAGTVAVVGTGLDRVYPARHRELAHRIVRSGAVISEFPPGMPPLPENFPQRNRIIAGMTRGTLVVEAALQSGSLITARFATEAGREVFAVPGSIHAPQSRGCHALIKQGAKLVESGADILEELQPGSRAAAPAAATLFDEPLPDPVLDALGHDPVTLDAIGARTGWSAAELAARLLDLELEGRVARLPGGLYQRRACA